MLVSSRWRARGVLTGHGLVAAPTRWSSQFTQNEANARNTRKRAAVCGVWESILSLAHDKWMRKMQLGWPLHDACRKHAEAVNRINGAAAFTPERGGGFGPDNTAQTFDLQIDAGRGDWWNGWWESMDDDGGAVSCNQPARACARNPTNITRKTTGVREKLTLFGCERGTDISLSLSCFRPR